LNIWVLNWWRMWCCVKFCKIETGGKIWIENEIEFEGCFLMTDIDDWWNQKEEEFEWNDDVDVICLNTWCWKWLVMVDLMNWWLKIDCVNVMIECVCFVKMMWMILWWNWFDVSWKWWMMKICCLKLTEIVLILMIENMMWMDECLLIDVKWLGIIEIVMCDIDRMMMMWVKWNWDDGMIWVLKLDEWCVLFVEMCCWLFVIFVWMNVICWKIIILWIYLIGRNMLIWKLDWKCDWCWWCLMNALIGVLSDDCCVDWLCCGVAACVCAVMIVLLVGLHPAEIQQNLRRTFPAPEEIGMGKGRIQIELGGIRGRGARKDGNGDRHNDWWILLVWLLCWCDVICLCCLHAALLNCCGVPMLVCLLPCCHDLCHAMRKTRKFSRGGNRRKEIFVILNDCYLMHWWFLWDWNGCVLMHDVPEMIIDVIWWNDCIDDFCFACDVCDIWLMYDDMNVWMWDEMLMGWMKNVNVLMLLNEHDEWWLGMFCGMIDWWHYAACDQLLCLACASGLCGFSAWWLLLLGCVAWLNWLLHEAEWMNDHDCDEMNLWLWWWMNEKKPDWMMCVVMMILWWTMMIYDET